LVVIICAKTDSPVSSSSFPMTSGGSKKSLPFRPAWYRNPNA
jgi:hypothetical protein